MMLSQLDNHLEKDKIGIIPHILPKSKLQMDRSLTNTMILYFTWTGKMTTPVDYDELCIYNVIPRATTKKLY